MKKVKTPPEQITNRRARFDYVLSDDLMVGMSLNGLQVRKIRDRKVQLVGSFVMIRNRELWLNNLTIGTEIAPNIRLLATKAQIASFMKQKELGYTIIPTKILANLRHIKLVITLGKGKKKFDKRETIKKRDIDREAKRFRN